MTTAIRSTLTCVILAILAFGCAAQQEAGQQDPPPQQEQRRGPIPSFDERVVLMDEIFPYDEEKPAAGHWHGNVFTALGVPAASVDISQNERGQWVIIASVTPGNQPHQRARNVEVDGRSVSFSFPLHPPEAGLLHFKGEVSEDGQRLTGIVEWDELPEPGTFTLGRSPLPMSLPDPIAYAGQVELDEDLFFDLTVVLAETPGGNWVGHIDIPSQAVAGWPLDRVKREGAAVIAVMGGGSPATFDGVISEDGGVFEGTYRQLENELPFRFERVDNYTVPEFAPMVMYESREVSIEHPDGHTIAGTLTVPPGDGPFPATVLISPSGAQDRDSNIFGKKFFYVLADHLTRRGVAVLRYDDRGIGQSGGQFQGATTADFASDAAAARAWLKAVEDIDAEAIGFIGHEEGATAALIAANQFEQPAFIVTLGGMGVSGLEHQTSQFEQQIDRVAEIDDALQAELVEAYTGLLSKVAEGAGDEALQASALALAEVQSRYAEALGAPARPADSVARLILGRLRQPWEQAFLRLDPPALLGGVECPVLAIWGSLDKAMPPEVNRPPLEGAAEHAGVDLTARTYEGLNHLLQPADTGDPSEYRTIVIAIHPQIAADIVKWIEAKVTAGVPEEGNE